VRELEDRERTLKAQVAKLNDKVEKKEGEGSKKGMLGMRKTTTKIVCIFTLVC
jgi:hypothetical protein